jgi:hypothetical protein
MLRWRKQLDTYTNGDTYHIAGQDLRNLGRLITKILAEEDKVTRYEALDGFTNTYTTGVNLLGATDMTHYSVTFIQLLPSP